MIKKILVSVAGRGLCEEMLNQLLDIPAIQQAKVTVLHVVPPQISSDEMPEKLEAGGKMLAEAVRSIKTDPSLITSQLKQGDPKVVVAKVADEEDVDLIVMGSRGLGRLRSILENSVSQYVFQLSSRPMLLVKDDIYVKRLSRVMLAYDNSDVARQALQTAIFLVKDLPSTQLILAHVTSAKPTDDVVGAAAESDEKLAPAVGELKRMGINYRCVTTGGKVGPELCRLADEMNADLFVLGTPDRRPSIAKGLPDLDLLLGDSVSDYVRVHADCPVMLTRQTTA